MMVLPLFRQLFQVHESVSRQISSRQLQVVRDPGGEGE
jgi:hypothetical protein